MINDLNLINKIINQIENIPKDLLDEVIEELEIILKGGDENV